MSNKKSNYRFSRSKFKRSRGGVSDIIGNLLILAITVSLFSGVLFFVNNMASPQDQTMADFSSPPMTNSSIYVTHKGGPTLSSNNTEMVIYRNNALVTTPAPIIHGHIVGHLSSWNWNIGEVWYYDLTGFQLNSDNVRLLIVDKTTNNIVWQATLAGNGGNMNTAPIITSRGLTPSPVYDGDKVYFFASITDLNGLNDVQSVYLNATSIGITPIVRLTDSNSDGIFTSGQYNASSNWNGHVVFFNVTSVGNNKATAQFNITVFRSGTSTNIYNYNNGTSGTGAPPGNLAYSGLQGFSIFEWNDWEKNKYNATPVTTFTRGQTAVVVIASKYVVNTQNTDTILVMNDTTKTVQTSVSSPSNSFTSLEVLSGYYIFNCSIKTSLLPSVTSYYLLSAVLKDNWNPNNMFSMNQVILVKLTDSTAIPGPTFATYSDSSFTKPTTSFTTYDPSSDVIYVEVTTKTGGAWVQGSGLVDIRDFFWDSQMSASPPADTTTGTYYALHATHWSGSVSNVWQSAVNKYRFEINLYNVTGLSAWLPGFNAYILKYDMFQGGSETYLLSKVINVSAPTNKLDIVAGGSPQGTARFSSQASLMYYNNDNSWYPPTLLETTTDKKSYNPVVSFVRAGDINGDGKTDFITVEDDGTYNLYLFIQQSSGGFTKYTVAALTSTVGDVQLGNTGLGTTLDIVIGYTNGVVQVYKNDGHWSMNQISGAGNMISAIAVANMAPPGAVGIDLNRSQDVVVGRTDGTITEYKNQNGIGTSWTSIKLVSGTTTTQDFAAKEDSTYYVALGTYIDTTSPIQLPYTYEALDERLVYVNQTSFAQKKTVRDGSAINYDNCSDTVDQLSSSPKGPYTVLPGEVASVNQWDSTPLANNLVTSKVLFTVEYKTGPEYATTDHIVWSNSTGNIQAPVNMVTIQNSNGNWVQATYDLTAKFPTASSLTGLNVTYINTNEYLVNTNTSASFRYWSLNVSWVTGDRLDHNWTINVPASGTSYTFSVYAYRTPSTDGDKIEFNYSVDNGVTWKAFGTHMYVATGLSFVQYTGTITGVLSNGIVKIKATAPWIQSVNPGTSRLYVGQMMITTTGAVSTSLGTNIAALTVADMNGDGRNEIVAIGSTGTMVVFNNIVGSSIFDHPSTAYATGIANAKTIAAGAFFNPYKSKYLDIAIATSSSVYLINQNKTTPGTYDSKITFLTGLTLYKMVAADVDGNGRCDILLATDTGISYYANYQGLKSLSQGWQYYIVDNQVAGSGGLLDMSARKFQTY